MRLIVIAALLSGMAGCISLGRDMHTDRAIEECEALIDVNERLACEQRIRDSARERNAEARD